MVVVETSVDKHATGVTNQLPAFTSRRIVCFQLVGAGLGDAGLRRGGFSKSPKLVFLVCQTSRCSLARGGWLVSLVRVFVGLSGPTLTKAGRAEDWPA